MEMANEVFESQNSESVSSKFWTDNPEFMDAQQSLAYDCQ